MTAAEHEQVKAAVRHLRARVAAAGAFRAAVRPKPGSPYATELATWRGNEPGKLAELLLMSADFHLLTLATACDSDEVYPLGGYTLIRGAAEPAARAAWLIDPEVAARKRRARVLVERLNSLQERRRFKDQRRRADDRIKILIGDAELLGHRLVRDPKTKQPSNFGEARTSATTLFGQLLPRVSGPDADPIGAALYRLLSGFTHSVPWALLAQADLFEGDEAGSTWARIELKPAWLLALLELALDIHDTAHRRLASNIGEGPTAWNDLLKTMPAALDARRLLAKPRR